MFPNFKKEFGITDEQIAKLHESMRDMPKPEGVEAVFKALEQKLDEDINYIPTEAEEAEIESAFRAIFENLDSVAANAFSDEQIQKMDGMMFGLTGGLESLMLGEKHLLALELTNEQKEQFKAINKEIKPERDKMLADLSAEMQKMMKVGKINFKELEAFGLQFKGFAEDLKQRRIEILTESQLAKAATLSKPPKFLTASPIGMMLPQWVPGPNSWKPGDGAPEPNQPERNRRRGFPREEFNTDSKQE